MHVLNTFTKAERIAEMQATSAVLATRRLAVRPNASRTAIKTTRPPRPQRERFLQALYRTCGTIDYQIQTFGRPRRLVEDMVFCSVLKVYLGVSARKLTPEIEAAKDAGLIKESPPYNTVIAFLSDERNRLYLLTPILQIDALMKAHPSQKKRRHARTNWASGMRFLSRSLNGLINELLCAKTCELISKIIRNGQDVHLPERGRPPAITDVDTLLSKIEKAVPRFLRQEIREDVCQEVALAVLSGELDVDKIEQKVRLYIRKLNKIHSLRQEISLDHPVYGGTDDRLLIEKIAG